MAALYWLAFLGSLCIGTVEGAGYLGRMPHHGGSCYYEDIKNAHFSYDEETCRSKTFYELIIVMVGFKSKYLFRIKKREKIRYIAVNISNIFYFFIFPFLLFKNEKKSFYTSKAFDHSVFKN